MLWTAGSAAVVEEIFLAMVDCVTIFFGGGTFVLSAACCASVEGGVSFFSSTDSMAAFFWGGTFVLSAIDSGAAFFFGALALRFLPFLLAGMVVSTLAFSATIFVAAAPGCFSATSAFASGWTSDLVLGAGLAVSVGDSFPDESDAVFVGTASVSPSFFAWGFSPVAAITTTAIHTHRYSTRL